MNIDTIKNAVTSKAVRQALITQKHSPTILFGVGVVGVIATVVLASRATLNLDMTLQETQDNLEKAENLHERGHASYTDKDYQQDRAILHIRNVTKVAKLYAPALAVGVISIGCLTGSHLILTKRNFALTAAYAAVEKGFAEYRGRVRDELGEDKEREFRYGSETVVESKVDDKGKTKAIEKKQIGPHGASIYAVFFDNRSSSWSPQPEYNMLFLRAQQNWLNDRLMARGHVILNEAYDALGLEHTTAGCVVGWVKGDGDSYIDFGIFDGQNMDRFYDFVTGNEGAILLDFNVDGVVYDKI
jgi:hypothetical protein